MACVSPVLVKNRSGVILAPCGKCLSCCMARQSALSFICSKELQSVYSRGLGASFVTLTYDSLHVPYVDGTPYMTLVKKDLQDYLKRLRRYIDRSCLPPIKFLACGEYGDDLGRPHYHLVYFGLSDVLADGFTRKAWTFGLSKTGALSSGGLAYVLKYMTKNRVGSDIRAFYEDNGIQKPFIQHSQGLGRDWIFTHADEIVSSGFTFVSRGKKRLYPKYVRDLVYKITGVNPRDYLQDYYNSINTHGLPLNDYLTIQTYKQEMNAYKQLQLNNKAVSLTQYMCVPPALRVRGTDTDVSKVVADCLYLDEIPF